MNTQNTVTLPPALLARLAVRHKNPNNPGYYTERQAMREAAAHFGIDFPNTGRNSGTRAWNLTIDALDDAYPNWRGYPAPPVNREMAKVLAHRSERDAA